MVQARERTCTLRDETPTQGNDRPGPGKRVTAGVEPGAMPAASAGAVETRPCFCVGTPLPCFEFPVPLAEGPVIPSELLPVLLERSGPDGWPVHWLAFLDTGVLCMGNWYAAKFLQNAPRLFGNAC